VGLKEYPCRGEEASSIFQHHVTDVPKEQGRQQGGKHTGKAPVSLLLPVPWATFSRFQWPKLFHHAFSEYLEENP